MAEGGLPGSGSSQYILPLLHSERSAREHWLRGVGAILSQWPPPAKLQLKSAKSKKAMSGCTVCVELLQLYHAHKIVFVEQRQCWVCMSCGRSTRGRRKGAFGRATCTVPAGGGAAERAAKTEAAIALQHKPQWARTKEGTFLLACMKCGATSEARAGGMASECPGVPGSAGSAHRLRRFRKGLHPLSKSHITLVPCAAGGLATS